MFPKPMNLYLDFRLLVTLLYRHSCRLLNTLQSLNFLEFIFLLLFLLLHMLSTSFLLLIRECTYTT